MSPFPKRGSMLCGRAGGKSAYHARANPGESRMRACIQRVTRASVSVDGQACGEIGSGMLVLLGVATGDTEADARQLATKLVGLRIFDDEQGKMNLSLEEIAGAMLV